KDEEDLQVAVCPQHPGDISLPHAEDSDDCEPDDVRPEPVAERQEQSADDKQGVVDVERPEPAQIVNGGEQDVGETADGADIERDVGATLTADQLRILRNNSGRGKTLEPAAQDGLAFWRTAHELVKLRHIPNPSLTIELGNRSAPPG